MTQLRKLLPYCGLALMVFVWAVAVRVSGTRILPGPLAVGRALIELARHGLLFKYVVASLYRVTWGWLGAVVLAVPLGLALGWFRRAERALNPLIQIFRPISPLAWIPISILWFGVGDLPAVFIIFLGSFFPLVVASATATSNIPETYLNVGRNFGLSQWQIIRRVVFPAVGRQLVVGLRISLGIAWVVVVAAEMIAVNSGLGFLIIDARNAGNRYDLVVAGMVAIGVIGLLLDLMMRRLEGFYAQQAPSPAARGGRK
jgi:NitT/TauT family transport system permease protein